MVPLHVRISLRGELDDAVREELEGFVDRPLPGGQLLCGTVPDQTAFFAVMSRLEALALQVLEVHCRLEVVPHAT